MSPTISMISVFACNKTTHRGSNFPLISMFLKEFSISVEDMQSCLYFNPEESVIQKIKRNWSESDCCPVSLYLHPNIGDVSWHHTANSYMETVIWSCLCILYSRDGSYCTAPNGSLWSYLVYASVMAGSFGQCSTWRNPFASGCMESSARER